MPFSYSVETSTSIKIGTRMITLTGKAPDEKASTYELAYHATSRSDSIDLGSAADALNTVITWVNDAGTKLFEVVQLVRDALSRLPDPPANPPTGVPPAAESPLRLLKKIYDILKDIEFEPPAPGQLGKYRGGTDVNVFITDIVVKVSAKNGAPREFMLGLAFDFTEAKIFNIELKTAGIHVTANVS